jgi:hypothetical protein
MSNAASTGLPAVNVVIYIIYLVGCSNLLIFKKCFEIGRPIDVREDIIEQGNTISQPDYACDSRCVNDFVECIEQEDGASICRTRERNCLEECRL